jgi:glutamate synthase domain-containing protein 3
VCKSIAQDHGLETALDQKLLARCKDAIEGRGKVDVSMPIRNVHRTVGAMLAGEVARRYGPSGLPDRSIILRFTGSAGQSFGAFVVRGMELYLEGDANDYVGKGMSGGTIVVRPPATSTFQADANILIGNTSLYGATSGQSFFNGMAGERFAVRNSGAEAVVEGVGDHGCEYMTGGRVIVIGRTGRNFAAGMSGGYAYVYDEAGDFTQRCNMELVEHEALSDEDSEYVRSMLEAHVRLTGSAKATRLLASYSEARTRFVKVVPVEYRRVLEELEKRRSGSGERQLEGGPVAAE